MTSKKRSKITILSIVFVFLLTTLLGLNIFTPIGTKASGEPSVLKFKQLAVGEDFAIALSYDNELYGFSLLDGASENSLGSTSGTLGRYYPKNPIKINVDLPNYGSNPNVREDKIAKIAATRTTAAFITEGGYIYTWGYDAPTESSGEGSKALVIKGLLLNASFQSTVADVRYAPALINDDLIKMGTAGNAASFSSNTYKALDIVGNGDNYAVSLQNRESEEDKKYFIWGDSSFNQATKTGNYQYDTKSPILAENNTYSDFYVGQGFVIARGSNGTLNFKGKNYFLPSYRGFNVSGDVVELDSIVQSGAEGSFYLKDESNATDAKSPYKVNNAFVNAFTSIGGEVSTSAAKANFVYGDGDSEKSIDVTLPSVSFGNGYGYYVSGGTVYFIGNAVNNQAGTDLSSVEGYGQGFGNKWQSTGLSNVTQVVAGKTKQGKHTVTGSYPFLFRDEHSKNSGCGAVGNVSSGRMATFSHTEDNDFYDGEVYISAALKNDGTVVAWNKDIKTPTAVEFEKFTPNANNKIVSLTAGYENELFALSNVGRIYRIKAVEGKFIGTPIDTFSNGTGAINPWSVNKLSVNFKGGLDGYNTSESQDKAKISVKINYDYSDNEDKALDINAVANSDAKFIEAKGGNFIDPASNIAKDAYRIIINGAVSGAYGITVPDAFDGNGDKDVTPANSADVSSEFPVGAIKFYSRPATGSGSDTELSYDVVKNFIDFKVVVDASSKETYFEITPKKSTKQNNIILKFWIGRFDSKLNNAPDSSSVNFYDCKPVELTVSIENTTADFYEFENNEANDGYQGSEDGDPRMSKIPMLDANNNYNNKYSIALMDVSTGFDKIAEGIAALDSNLNKEKVLSDIITVVKDKDKGFPAKSRISDGNLDYTLGSTMAGYYYKDRYKFYASDIDGTRVQVYNNIIAGENNINKNAIAVLPITVNIDLSGYNIDKNALKDFINTGDEYNEVFNNLYGFYQISVTESVLSFRYDVITVTASLSTGSVTYNGSQTVSVASPIFTDANGNGGDSFQVNLQEIVSQEQTNFSNSVQNYFHVQSSLRMKDDYKTEDNTVYGKSGSNVYRYAYSDGTTTNIQVGAEKNKNIAIKISEFFNDVSDYSGIKFSYGVRTGDTAFNEFKNNFNPSIIDVSLTADTFTFTPKEAGVTEIMLTARRFYSSAYFGEDETINIYVTVTATPPTFRLRDDVSSVTMSGTHTLSVTDRFVVGDPSIAKIEYVTVTDTSVVRVSYNESEATFTARKSGVVNVSFTASFYNTVLRDSFQLIVEDIAQMDNVYAVSDMKNIYIDDVKRFLLAANASSDISLKNLVLDREDETDRTQGFYFQQYLLTDSGSREWTDVDVKDLGYISNAYINLDATGQYVRLELKSVGSQEIPNPTRIVIRFRNESTGKIYSAAAQFAPANQLVQADGTKDPFIFEINYGKDFENQGTDANLPSRTESNTVLLPLRYITSMMPNSIDYEDATISFVSAQNGYEEFFTLDKTTTAAGDCISITPLYPTKTLENDYATVNVSIRDSSGTGYLLSFYVRISGIRIDLDKEEYANILLIAFLSSLAFLFIIFMIRMAVYWKRKAGQRRIIRKNQMLIKMRDKMHNNKTAAPREQIVKTKMKMDDPKYAKMFEQMRQKKEAETGISLDNSEVAKKAKQKSKAADKKSAKGKKGKKGKKSIEELKAELEAKKMAFAQMQMDGNVSSMGGEADMGMDMNMGEAPIFDNVDEFAGAEVQPEFDADFIDPDSIQIDDLGDN